MRKKIIYIAFSVLIVAIASVVFVSRGYEEKPSYLSGDEPHYIMLTDNLVHYGNFDLKLSYRDHRSRLYYPWGPLAPHKSPIFTESSPHWYSIHTIGLPLLMAGPYMLGGVMGARIFLILLQLCLIPLFYLIVRRYIKLGKKQLFAMALLVFNPLYWQNVGAIMPDLVIITLAAAALVLFYRKDLWSNIALILLVILAYLVHSKGLLLTGPIVLAKFAADIWSQGFKRWLRAGWIYIGLGVVLMGAYSLLLLSEYGSLSPTKMYGSNGQLFTANPFFNAVATLTDRNKGLLLYVPILIILPLYLYRSLGGAWIFCKDTVQKIKKRHLLKPDQFAALGVTGGLGLLFITQIGFIDWSGSTSPNGRYYLVFVVAAIFIVAKYVHFKNWLEMAVVGAIALVYLYMWKLSVVNFKNYMSTDTNSFLVVKYPKLLHLPMFDIIVWPYAIRTVMKGAELLGILLAGNVAWIWLVEHIDKRQSTDRHV